MDTAQKQEGITLPLGREARMSCTTDYMVKSVCCDQANGFLLRFSWPSGNTGLLRCKITRSPHSSNWSNQLDG